MSRSVLSISAGLASVSVVVAGLWVSQGLRSGGEREKQPSFAAQSAPDGPSVRSVYPGPLSGPAQRISPPPQNRTAAPTPPAAAPTLASSEPLTDRNAPPELAPPQKQAELAPTGGEAVAAVAAPSDPQRTPAGPSTNLNTASVEELNALGAGMIGRRIIVNRPYTSPEDLVSKRILKRADFEIIKAAVTVR